MPPSTGRDEMNVKNVNFKECPFCGSEQVCALQQTPDYDHVGNQYHEPCICGHCDKEFVIVYQPYRYESDDLTAQDLLNSKRK